MNAHPPKQPAQSEANTHTSRQRLALIPLQASRFGRICLGFIVLGFMAFLGLVVWASLTGAFTKEFAYIVALPWGKVAMADLYLGFAIFTWVILSTAPTRCAALMWTIGLFCLGNLISLAYLLYLVHQQRPASPKTPNPTKNA